jgi:hypothetical protein
VPIVQGRGGNFSRGGIKVGIFGKFFMKGGGNHFWAREREKMVYNKMKLCLLPPFLLL